MRRITLAAAGLAAIALTASGVAAAHPTHGGGHPGGDHAGDLAKVRKATARYHSVNEARRAGYQQAGPCAEEPELGGMGYHYVNPELVANRAVRPKRPEALLYEPHHGELRLVAVEWVRNDADQDLDTDEDRPWLFGIPFDGPMLGHEPDQPIHYDLHAWVWKHNPAGTFAQWNPRVSCP